MSKLTKCIFVSIMVALLALPAFASGSGEAASASGGQSAVEEIIQQAEGGYFYSDWYLEIGGEDTKLCDVKVIDRQRKNRDLSMILLAQVRYRNTYFNTTLELSYRLGDNLVWNVNFLRTIDIVPVNPGKYDSCITLRYDIGFNRTCFTNSSDISLLVGGTAVSYSQKERYIVKVEPFTYNCVYGNASVDFVIPATY